MKTPTERTCEAVRWAMHAKELNVVEIEDRGGINRGQIGKWLSGERKSISAENAAKILMEFPEVSAEWLMRDEGNMLKAVSNVKTGTDPKPLPSADRIMELEKENERLRLMLDAAHTHIARLIEIKTL